MPRAAEADERPRPHSCRSLKVADRGNEHRDNPQDSREQDDADEEIQRTLHQPLWPRVSRVEDPDFRAQEETRRQISEKKVRILLLYGLQNFHYLSIMKMKRDGIVSIIHFQQLKMRI